MNVPIIDFPMFRLVDLVEVDLIKGIEKKTFRIELFEDATKPRTFRARLWEIQVPSYDANLGVHFTGGLRSTEKTLVERSSFLPNRFCLPFASVTQQAAMESVSAGFAAVWTAIQAS